MQVDKGPEEKPHVFLARIAAGEPIHQARWEIEYDDHGRAISRVLVQDDYYPTFAERVMAARACAPFFAPRLSASAVSSDRETEVADVLKALADRLPV